jgi:hypothetical protein
MEPVPRLFVVCALLRLLWLLLVAGILADSAGGVLWVQMLAGEYGFIAQLNEGRHLKKRATEFRVDQVLQPFDPAKFNFTKVGKEEVLFRFEQSEDGHSEYYEYAPVSKSPNVVIINVSTPRQPPLPPPARKPVFGTTSLASYPKQRLLMLNCSPAVHRQHSRCSPCGCCGTHAWSVWRCAGESH